MDDVVLGEKRRLSGGCPVGQFGDKFRKAREKKSLSLDDVSNVTKIGSRMLQAIEEERFEQLPGGVFNKGFIRAYAKQVGLNDEEAVNEYLACLRQAQIDAQAIWEPNARQSAQKHPRVAPDQIAANKAVASKLSPRSERPYSAKSDSSSATTARQDLPELQLPRLEDVRPPRRQYLQKRQGQLPWRPAIMAFLILVMLAVLWQRHARHAHAESATAVTAATAVVASSGSQTAPGAGTAAQSSLVSNDKTARDSTGSDRLIDKRASIGKTESANASPLSSGASPRPAANGSQNGQDDDDTTAAPASRPAPESSKLFTLVIRATENSWISVTADGQPVSHETLIAPANTSVHANREIVARVGNAAGVSFLWNGQEIQPEGAESEVKTFIFDAAGMHEAAAPQEPAQTR